MAAPVKKYKTAPDAPESFNQAQTKLFKALCYKKLATIKGLKREDIPFIRELAEQKYRIRQIHRSMEDGMYWEGMDNSVYQSTMKRISKLEDMLYAKQSLEALWNGLKTETLKDNPNQEKLTRLGKLIEAENGK